MKKTVDEINKMIMEDAPMEEINDAIGYIDICSCFDPILHSMVLQKEDCAASQRLRHSSRKSIGGSKIGSKQEQISI